MVDEEENQCALKRRLSLQELRRVFSPRFASGLTSLRRVYRPSGAHLVFYCIPSTALPASRDQRVSPFRPFSDRPSTRVPGSFGRLLPAERAGSTILARAMSGHLKRYYGHQHSHFIVEVTSGNAGIAFAAVGRMLGHPATKSWN